MNLLFALLAVAGTAFAATPSEAELVAKRSLPMAPQEAEAVSRVICTAVISVGEDGEPKDVGVAAGEYCQGPWARAAQTAVSDWRWPSALAGAKGHVTVVWDGEHALAAKAWKDDKALEVLEKKDPRYPKGLKTEGLGDVVCRAMVGVTASGAPAVVAVDACPSEFQEEAANTLLRWRWNAHEGDDLGRTWVLVNFDAAAK